MASKRHFVLDANLKLKDAGLIAADAAAQVGGVNKILDLGASRVDGTVIVDVTAIEIASNDERYDIGWQLSSKADFADTIVQGPILALGALETLIGADADSAVGRYELPVSNEVNGTVYRYARLYTNVTGTIATGINYSAFLAAPAA